MKKTIFRFFLSLFVVVSLSGCTTDTNNSDTTNQEVDKEQIDLQELMNQIKPIIYALPSPVETAMMFENAKVGFNETILNPVSNMASYSSSHALALNLGIYSADLSYISLYEQSQTAIQYMATTKKMADKLGILDAISEETVKKFEENVNNRSVIMNTISQTLLNTDSYLEENYRPEVAALTVIGGWIEGLYIATQLTEKSLDSNEDLVNIVIDQKISLTDVISLMAPFKSDEMKEIDKQLKKLKTIYDKIEYSTGIVETEINSDDNQTTLKSQSNIKVSPETFTELCTEVEQIRNSFVQMN